MTLPVGVTTRTYSLKRSFDAFGDDAMVSVVITPDFGGNATALTWTATDETFENFPVNPDPTHPDGADTETFTLPVVDQMGWADGSGNTVTDFFFRATIVATKGGGKNKRTKILRPKSTDPLTMDLNAQPDGTAAGAPTVAPPDYDAKFAKRVLVPAARLTVRGHSIPHGSGVGVTPGSNDMSTLTAAAVGLQLDNESIAGAVLYNHLSQGDWGDIMQAETRPAKFKPVGGAYALMYGINDGAYLGNTTTALRPFKEALRASVARLRCAAVFEESNSSVAYGGSGTWATTNTTAGNSGTNVKFNATSGATFTISTPTNFPGGVLDVGLIAWSDGSYGTVTGPSSLGSPAYDLSLIAGTDCRRTGVLRITGVPAGAASYTFTTSAASGPVGVVFDWWGWEPHESACPVVALVGQPKPLDYTAQAGSPAGPMTDAGIDVVNGIQAAVATEFGARVLYVDNSALDKSATYFVAGNIHPNAAGHAYIAQQTAVALDGVGQFVEVDLNDSTAPTTTSSWVNFNPTLTGVTLGAGTVQASYRNAGDNVTEFYCRVTLAADSAVTGAVTVALPTSAVTAYSKVGFDVTLLHSGASYYAAKALLLSLGTLTIRSLGTAGVLADLSSTVPFAWATNDYLEVSGRYRTA